MKYAVTLLVLFAFFGALLAHAQSYTNPYFEHIIIVIQENRTPDNLFGSYALTGPCPTQNVPLPWLGAGYDLSLPPTQSYNGNPQAEVSWCFGTCFSPGHTHGDWEAQYNSGGTYLPWKGNVSWESCPTQKATCNGQPIGCSGQGCMPIPLYPQETYSDPFYDAGSFTNSVSGLSALPLTPYFDIAAKYGFANYFFQTNQGPSQPAHDFLFGGTSSPVGALKQTGDTSQYYEFFFWRKRQRRYVWMRDGRPGQNILPQRQRHGFK